MDDLGVPLFQEIIKCANALGDTFHFELQHGASSRVLVMRGLFRVFDREVALQLIRESGVLNTQRPDSSVVC